MLEFKTEVNGVRVYRVRDSKDGNEFIGKIVHESDKKVFVSRMIFSQHLSMFEMREIVARSADI
jgi:L-lactate utilization protein LutB